MGRPDELRRLLQSIAQQDMDCEVIVVDQSDDATSAAVADTLQAFELPVTHLRTSVRNSSLARNMGIQAARGDILGFPDDDCAYSDGLLRRVSEMIGGPHPLVSGQYVDWDGTRTYFPQERVVISGLGIFDRLSAITFFVLRKDNMPLFDPVLGGGGALRWSEEIDYGIRYTARFGPGVYDPSLVIHHAVRRASIDNAAARTEIRRARGYVLTKNLRVLGASSGISLVKGAVKDLLNLKGQRTMPMVSGLVFAFRRREK